MSNSTTTDAPRTTRRKHVRRHINVEGDVLIPRAEFAADILGVTDRTAQRMNLPTVYLVNVAYVQRDASLQLVRERVCRRNQPPRRRRGRAAV